jgi:hypothetical protein
MLVCILIYRKTKPNPFHAGFYLRNLLVLLSTATISTVGCNMKLCFYCSEMTGNVSFIEHLKHQTNPRQKWDISCVTVKPRDISYWVSCRLMQETGIHRAEDKFGSLATTKTAIVPQIWKTPKTPSKRHVLGLKIPEAVKAEKY